MGWSFLALMGKWFGGVFINKAYVVGVAAACAAIALSWRSGLIEKGETKAVQRIEKQEKKRAKVIRSAGAKSVDNSVRGTVDRYTVD
jgi:hypothetical protein